jgi:hypothetical protein
LPLTLVHHQVALAGREEGALGATGCDLNALALGRVAAACDLGLGPDLVVSPEKCSTKSGRLAYQLENPTREITTNVERTRVIRVAALACWNCWSS